MKGNPACGTAVLVGLRALLCGLYLTVIVCITVMLRWALKWRFRSLEFTTTTKVDLI